MFCTGVRIGCNCIDNYSIGVHSNSVSLLLVWIDCREVTRVVSYLAIIWILLFIIIWTRRNAGELRSIQEWIHCRSISITRRHWVSVRLSIRIIISRASATTIPIVIDLFTRTTTTTPAFVIILYLNPYGYNIFFSCGYTILWWETKQTVSPWHSINVFTFNFSLFSK